MPLIVRRPIEYIYQRGNRSGNIDQGTPCVRIEIVDDAMVHARTDIERIVVEKVILF